MSKIAQIPDIEQIQTENAIMRQQLRLAYIGLLWVSQNGSNPPLKIEREAEKSIKAMDTLGEPLGIFSKNMFANVG